MAGQIAVAWREEDGMVVIDWNETGATIEQVPERRGFGSLLMTSAARQLRGSIERDFASDGVRIRDPFPQFRGVRRGPRYSARRMRLTRGRHIAVHDRTGAVVSQTRAS